MISEFNFMQKEIGSPDRCRKGLPVRLTSCPLSHFFSDPDGQVYFDREFWNHRLSSLLLLKRDIEVSIIHFGLFRIGLYALPFLLARANMEKSIYTQEYEVLLDLLRTLREKRGVTQTELGELLDQSQSYVSKIERGDRRLDVIQLRTICLTLGSSLSDFVSDLEKRLLSK